DPAAGAAEWLSALRARLTERIRAPLTPAIGGVAAALMIGDQGAVPEPVLVAMRDSGLAHLLSISGLHMALLAATLFFAVRAGLALVPWVALRFPIKKWAAAATLLGAFGYLLISGAQVPTQRAFLMTGLVLLAVMLDRVAFSMALVAWAAAAVLLIAPESLLGASFQMSFAAVVCLIAAYEGLGARLAQWHREARLPRRAALYLAGIALTTLIAGTATAPYAAFHFNRVADYGLVANLIAVPITSLWVMPCALAAFALLPFGAEALALVPMGWGIAALLRCAETVAGWPGAVLAVPPMPGWALVTLSLGGLWLCLWRQRWRLAGALAVIVGCAGIAVSDPPDLIITGDAKLAAVRDGAGWLQLSSRRMSGIAAESLIQRFGYRGTAPWPGQGGSADARCDDLGCVFDLAGRRVALVFRPEALAEDCARADVLIAAVPVIAPCPRPHPVVDRFDLWREGAHAFWISATGPVRVETVRAARGARPWVRRPERAGRDDQ
ncbi:MAG: ComEC/Rec2 family competence protein, partial [Alphaproteobacteria bacterium]|nr:ComEC/Rec2 family competence protein [Alphaproteobacteria bacterium]